MSLQQLPQVAKHIYTITKNDMKIDGDNFHTIESYGPAGEWHISFRDNPFNVDKYDVYGLKKFIKYVFGIPTSSLKRDELVKIYLDRVEGSYSSKKQPKKTEIGLPVISSQTFYDEYIPLPQSEVSTPSVYIPLPLPSVYVPKRKSSSKGKRKSSSKGKRKSSSKGKRKSSSKGKRKSSSKGKRKSSSKGKRKSSSKGKRK